MRLLDLDFWLDSLERVVKVIEPVYFVLAAALVSIDAYVFFTTVMREVGGRQRCLARSLTDPVTRSESQQMP